MDLLKNNGDINLNIRNNSLPNIQLATSYNALSNSTNEYMVFLPVLCIILFLFLLFLIYAFKNLNLRTRLEYCCCLLFSSKSRIPSSYMSRTQFNNGSNRQSVYWHRAPNLYEDANSGYYRVQNPDYINFHHNYEQIHVNHPTFVYRVNQPVPFTMTSNENPDINKIYFSSSKFIVNNNPRPQNYYHMSNTAKMIGALRSETRSKSVDNDYDLFANRRSHIRRIRKVSTVRRSYSNSRLDQTRWKKQLEKRIITIILEIGLLK